MMSGKIQTLSLLVLFSLTVCAVNILFLLGVYPAWSLLFSVPASLALSGLVLLDSTPTSRLTQLILSHSKLISSILTRSEERRVGKECVSPCRYRLSTYN